MHQTSADEAPTADAPAAVEPDTDTTTDAPTVDAQTVDTPTAPAPGDVEEPATPGEREQVHGDPAAGTPAGAEPAPIRRRRADLLALAAYAALACWLFAHLLTSVNGHYLADSNSDQRQMEFYFQWVAWALTHGHNPFFVSVMNAPVGVNGMGNTIVFALSAPMTPITLLFGPAVSFTTAMVLGMTATAWCWYWLFSRHVVGSRLAAAIGGGLVAFSPTMVSHANGHVNMVVHFAVPLIIGMVLRLREPGHTVRKGVLLGLLAAVQVMIGAELLLVAALGFGVFLIAYCAQNRAALRAGWRTTAAGLGIAMAVSLPLLAYPLWFQFAGPEHYAGLPFTRFLYADPMSYVSFSTRSLAGGAGAPGKYAMGNLTEENGFFGWPLVLLTLGLVAWFRRSVTVRAAAVTGVVFALFSLGNRIFLRGHDTGIPGPWRYLHKLPLLENIIPSRLEYVTVPMVALLVVLGTDRALALAPKARAAGVPLRALWLGTLAVALVPILPTPLHVVNRRPVPVFFTDGTWRSYVHDGGSVVPVPITRSPFDTAAVDWQMATDMGFPIAGGYFVGPWSADKYGPDGHGWFDAQPRPTDTLLQHVEKTGVPAIVGPAEQSAAKADLTWWHGQVVVLDPRTVKHPDELRTTLDSLTGVTGVFVKGVWVWDVRSVTTG